VLAMGITERLLRLLQEARVKFELLPHREVFTCQQVAEASHISGRLLAKVVVLHKPDGDFVMVALPASEHLDPMALREVTGLEEIALASEDEIRRRFPDCEVGAMPPFGDLYGMPLYLDRCLAAVKDIYFQAGNHHEVVRMKVSDYQRLARPTLAGACVHRNPMAARS
jgi:Ala-tRNA(Pro) deacylase